MSRLVIAFAAVMLLNPFFTNDSSAQGRRPSLQSPSESNPVPTAPMGRGGQGRASMGQSGASSGPSAVRGGHGHGGQSSPLFAALDQNKDGLLSEAELRSAAAVMKALDKDGDGKLSQAECQPAGGGGHGGSKADPQAEAAATVEKLMTFDKNDDQILTKDELPERMQDVIKRADSNGDGMVTNAELKAMALKELAPANPGVGAPGRGRFRQPSSPLRPPVDGDVKE